MRCTLRARASRFNAALYDRVDDTGGAAQIRDALIVRAVTVARCSRVLHALHEHRLALSKVCTCRGGHAHPPAGEAKSHRRDTSTRSGRTLRSPSPPLTRATSGLRQRLQLCYEYTRDKGCGHADSKRRHDGGGHVPLVPQPPSPDRSIGVAALAVSSIATTARMTTNARLDCCIGNQSGNGNGSDRASRGKTSGAQPKVTHSHHV